jgi:hypothetical protein
MYELEIRSEARLACGANRVTGVRARRHRFALADGIGRETQPTGS